MVFKLGTARVVSSLGKYLSIPTGPHRIKAPMVVSGYHNQNLGNIEPKTDMWESSSIYSMPGRCCRQRGKNKTPRIYINNPTCFICK